MKITIPVSIVAADTDARTISGRIVTWGEAGNTSAGKTIFAKDSIALKPVKLFVDHNMDAPIGRVLDFDNHDEGIDATFKISDTQRGRDSLVEAMDGLKDGFSVGIKLSEYDNTDEGLVVKMSQLVEVSLVETPAIDSARVSEVAASDETNEQEGSDMTETPELQTENEVSVEAPKVEAAKATSAPVFTSPRVDTNVTAGQVAIAQVRAMLGNSEARDLVAAIEQQNTTTDSGLVPPTYLREVIGIVDGQRPFWDSVESGVLPASGMKFYKPRRVVLATTAETAEEAEFDSTETEIDNVEIDVIKIAGANIVSVELIDRSSPEYVDELLRQLAADWARKSDLYAFAQIAGSAVASDGATLYQGIAQGIADSYGEMRFTPNRFLADVGNYADLLKSVDDSGRPLFAAAAPSNANGLMTQGSTAGTIAGLQLVVDPNITSGAGNFGFVYPSAAGTVYQSGAIQLRSNIVATGQVEIGLYGYVAAVANYPDAVRKITVTPVVPDEG
jgi:HK97 family phage prohead protease